MMRQGYSYRCAGPPDGSIDQGHSFLPTKKVPTTSFIPLQQRLSAHAALEHFTVTTASALSATLPGITTETDWLGSALLA